MNFKLSLQIIGSVIVLMLCLGRSESLMFTVGPYDRCRIDPNDVFSWIDVNNIDPNIGLLCGGMFILETSELFVADVNAYDPDGEPMILSLASGPEGLIAINNTDGMSIHWQPSITQLGIHYVIIRVTDVPPEGSIGGVGSDEAVIAIKVVHTNRPPIIGGCSIGR